MDRDTVLSWRGQTMHDAEGEEIGEIAEIYLDDETGQPEWALVHTGLLGTKSTFVPVAQASGESGQIRVNYSKATVKDAPRIDTSQELSQEEEAELYHHYGLRYSQVATGAGLPEDAVGVSKGPRTADDEHAGGDDDRTTERR
ncbi:MAG: PRC-barrel domain-containing protein [Actinomycetota bacterium]|nr:PRC-barrel domain-containing protein [Actinomycetota bacterium]